jgi:hypothetical protein
MRQDFLALLEDLTTQISIAHMWPTSHINMVFESEAPSSTRISHVGDHLARRRKRCPADIVR